MRTIAVINQKGGCGKTTCSINLSAVLAAKGYRTLLVDVDPQSHCALGLAVPEAQIERSTADLLHHGLDGTLALADITWQISRNLDLAPSSMGLAGVEARLAAAPDKDRRLAQVLSTVQDRYDFVIVDCPPSIGLLTFNALRAADEVIVPVETGFFSMQGSIKQHQTIQMLARRVGHSVRFSVLPTMYDVRTKLAREILSELKKQFGDQLLPLVINFNSKLKEAASFGQPITEYDPASRGMQDFDVLADWLVANPPVSVVPIPGVPVSGVPIPGVQIAPMEAPMEPAHAHAPAPAQPAHAAAAPPPGRSSNPSLSRAAELVERARALSAKTARLTASFAADPDMVEARVPQPVAPRPQEHGFDDQPTPSLQDKLARIYGVRPTTKGVLFVQPADGAHQVAVAGDFNDWNPSRSPLRRDENLGVWQACIPIPPGRYRYRLVIDGKWVQDPHNQTVETNPYGELNNVIEVE